MIWNETENEKVAETQYILLSVCSTFLGNQ